MSRGDFCAGRYNLRNPSSCLGIKIMTRIGRCAAGWQDAGSAEPQLGILRQRAKLGLGVPGSGSIPPPQGLTPLSRAHGLHVEW